MSNDRLSGAPLGSGAPGTSREASVSPQAEPTELPRVELAAGYSIPRIINGAWQLSEGAVLYRDIAYFNGPLSPYFNAMVTYPMLIR